MPPSSATTLPSASSTVDTPTRDATRARTASQAALTAPPDMYDCRDADDDPAEPTVVSAGWMTTVDTPSSVRAICCCSVIRP